MRAIKTYILIIAVFFSAFSFYAVSSNMGMTLFDDWVNISECRHPSGTEIIIFQALTNESGLASKGNRVDINNLFFYFDTRQNILLYDNQIIRIPAGYCLIHTGIYRYETRGGRISTIPTLTLRPDRSYYLEVERFVSVLMEYAKNNPEYLEENFLKILANSGLSDRGLEKFKELLRLLFDDYDYDEQQ